MNRSSHVGNAVSISLESIDSLIQWNPKTTNSEHNWITSRNKIEPTPVIESIHWEYSFRINCDHLVIEIYIVSSWWWWWLTMIIYLLVSVFHQDNCIDLFVSSIRLVDVNEISSVIIYKTSFCVVVLLLLFDDDHTNQLSLWNISIDHILSSHTYKQVVSSTRVRERERTLTSTAHVTWKKKNKEKKQKKPNVSVCFCSVDFSLYTTIFISINIWTKSNTIIN
jgi:hypothetical protein